MKAFIFTAVCACCTTTMYAQEAFEVPDDVQVRTADIFSEGTRMTAEVFTPIDVSGKLPTILMSHGCVNIGQKT